MKQNNTIDPFLKYEGKQSDFEKRVRFIADISPKLSMHAKLQSTDQNASSGTAITPIGLSDHVFHELYNLRGGEASRVTVEDIQDAIAGSKPIDLKDVEIGD